MTPETLDRERPYLTGLAYRMLGSTADAEDVVQEALARASSIDEARSPRALLTTIVTRLCLDELRSARRRREAYVGAWLPDPVLTADPGAPSKTAVPADDRVDAVESLSMAFLVLIESLTPHERAVFVLREVFDVDFSEIASAVGRSEAACRQLLHRAREHVATGRRRFPAAHEQSALASRFMAALAAGDTTRLVELLVSEATCITDHGGKARAARRTVVGAASVAKLLVGLYRKKENAPGVEARSAWVNGGPAVLVYADGVLDTVLVFDVAVVGQGAAESPRVVGFYVHRNPDRIRRELLRLEARS